MGLQRFVLSFLSCGCIPPKKTTFCPSDLITYYFVFRVSESFSLVRIYYGLAPTLKFLSGKGRHVCIWLQGDTSAGRKGIVHVRRSGNSVWLTNQEKPVHSQFPLGAPLPHGRICRGRGKQQEKGSAPENCLTLPPASGPRVTRLRHSHRNFPLASGVSSKPRFFTVRARKSLDRVCRMGR